MDEILADFPDLEADDIAEALRYAATHRLAELAAPVVDEFDDATDFYAGPLVVLGKQHLRVRHLPTTTTVAFSSKVRANDRTVGVFRG